MFHSRNYAGLADLEMLKNFLMAQRATGATGYMHVGDLLWGMFMHAQKNPKQEYRLWFAADGSVAGFLRLGQPGYFEMQVAAHLRGQVEPDMLAWVQAHDAGAGAAGAAAQAIEIAPHEPSAERPPAWTQTGVGAGRHSAIGSQGATSVAQPKTAAQPIKLTTEVMESETKTRAWLLERGFARNDFEMFILTCDLSKTKPPPALANAVIRPVAGEGDFAERVSIHREVWEPSKVTLEGYRLTRAAPGYDPELDIAVVTDAGEFAAYCIMWPDALNKIAEFEPVGARKAHRGKGFGKALLLDGFARLREKGMTTALVYCYAHNLPFYKSAGFNVVDKYVGYER